jgi:hypothetical protein
MTPERRLAYIVELVRSIRSAPGIEDEDEVVAICKSIGKITPATLIRMLEMEGTPEEISKALGGRTVTVDGWEDEDREEETDDDKDEDEEGPP